VTEPPEIRVGDAEREEALRALGDHMSAGRLDIEEYGDRTARATAAKTRGELIALFADLPEPKPHFGPPAPAQQPVRQAEQPIQSWQQRPLPQRLYGALIPISFIIAAALFFTVARGFWFIFLLPAAVTVIGGSLWGDDWSHDRRAWQRQQRHRRRRHWE
jgi:hypothetical protein